MGNAADWVRGSYVTKWTDGTNNLSLTAPIAHIRDQPGLPAGLFVALLMGFAGSETHDGSGCIFGTNAKEC